MSWISIAIDVVKDVFTPKTANAPEPGGPIYDPDGHSVGNGPKDPVDPSSEDRTRDFERGETTSRTG